MALRSGCSCEHHGPHHHVGAPGPRRCRRCFQGCSRCHDVVDHQHHRRNGPQRHERWTVKPLHAAASVLGSAPPAPPEESPTPQPGVPGHGPRQDLRLVAAATTGAGPTGRRPGDDGVGHDEVGERPVPFPQRNGQRRAPRLGHPPVPALHGQHEGPGGPVVGEHVTGRNARNAPRPTADGDTPAAGWAQHGRGGRAAGHAVLRRNCIEDTPEGHPERRAGHSRERRRGRHTSTVGTRPRRAVQRTPTATAAARRVVCPPTRWRRRGR